MMLGILLKTIEYAEILSSPDTWTGRTTPAAHIDRESYTRSRLERQAQTSTVDLEKLIN
jgi:hypothetical protein